MSELNRDEVVALVELGESLGDLDLSGLDLSGLALPGVDFEGADLEGADLSAADLTGANFSLAHLRSVRFCHANLRWTQWADSVRIDCDFAGARWL